MTRGEEIHKAAEEFAFSDKTETPDYHNAMNDFYYGAKWADETVIERACKWLLHQEEMIGISFEDDFIERFKKAMEE